MLHFAKQTAKKKKKKSTEPKRNKTQKCFLALKHKHPPL